MQVYKVGTGIDLFILNFGSRRGWVVKVTRRDENTVPILQDVGWSSGPVWKGAENLAPAGVRIQDTQKDRWASEPVWMGAENLAATGVGIQDPQEVGWASEPISTGEKYFASTGVRIRDPQEPGWALRPVWKGTENFTPTGIRRQYRTDRRRSLHRLDYHGR
jgi:hypothetical protein